MGKVEGKRGRGWPTSRWMDLVTVVLEDLKNQVRDRNLSMWMLTINNLMIQSITI